MKRGRGRPAFDLTGKRFGSLVVIERAGNHPTRRSVQWLCRCDCCGSARILQTDQLRYGRATSCKKYSQHGASKTRLYQTWLGMRSRCRNPSDPSYHNYGGRGITVCPEWQESFETFRDWALANGYRDDLTIDRIDVNGHYEPSNCRWATAAEQALNKRNNRFVVIGGARMTISQASEQYGVTRQTINNRLNSGLNDNELVRPAGFYLYKRSPVM